MRSSALAKTYRPRASNRQAISGLLCEIFLDDMGLFRRGRHASSSLMAEAVGSAIWIARPLTSNASDGSSPTARR